MIKIPEKETDIQLAICRYLELQGCFFWRQNTIPPTFEKNGMRQFRRMPKYSLNGIPDIIVIRDGRFIGLEVKTDAGTLSQSQKDFKELCQLAGAEYYVVRSVDDVREALIKI